MIHIPIENAPEDIDDEGTVISPITADASKQLYDVAKHSTCQLSKVELPLPLMLDLY